MRQAALKVDRIFAPCAPAPSDCLRFRFLITDSVSICRKITLSRHKMPIPLISARDSDPCRHRIPIHVDTPIRRKAVLRTPLRAKVLVPRARHFVLRFQSATRGILWAISFIVVAALRLPASPSPLPSGVTVSPFSSPQTPLLFPFPYRRSPCFRLLRSAPDTSAPSGNKVRGLLFWLQGGQKGNLLHSIHPDPSLVCPPRGAPWAKRSARRAFYGSSDSCVLPPQLT